MPLGHCSMNLTSHWTMLALIAGFAAAHSGLAHLRPWGEAWLGARGYRVGFALVSIPLAVLLLIYFFNHRYDGWMLWDVQGVPGMHALVWGLSALSFLFLYPATFNLLEIAAIQKPQIHLYATGIIRITRHPQMVGQVMWCLAHTLWVGSSFLVVTSLGLIAYHLFAVWHGDYRWERRYGEAFLAVKAQTSVVPFLAILQGRQPFVLQELWRWAYVGVGIAIGLFYFAHPYLIGWTQRVAW
ncbi:MAG: NnrU family protein [Synechococcales cyanobacterium]